jgi:hypothetical protein
MRSIHLAKLHLNAVIGVTIGGKYVQTASPRCIKLLGDDTDIA